MTNGHELETRLAAWRSHRLRSGEVSGADAGELESVLADEFAALREAGLDPGEAFLGGPETGGAAGCSNP